MPKKKTIPINQKSHIRELEKEIETLRLLVRAHDELEKMADHELLEAGREVRLQEKISEFSISELKQRDMSLRNILEIFQNILSIQDRDKLLERIIDGLMESIRAERGILYLNDKKTGIEPVIYKNITAEETKKDYFRFCFSNVIETAISRKNIMRMMEEIGFGDEAVSLSFICLPLVYEHELFGVIYLDVLSSSKTFRPQDLDIAELFSAQAAISINNVNLYEKIREQNLEFLKLINLKDHLIGDVSSKVKQPLTEIRKKLEEMVLAVRKGTSCSAGELGKIVSMAAGAEATVSKVITIQELEKEVADLFSDTVNFNELIQFIIQYHDAERVSRGITVTVKLSQEMEAYHCNRAIMRMIFDELISNAIFYNRPGGKVDITGSRKGDFLVVTVTDTGYGIRFEDQEKVFEQFFRTQDSSRYNDKGAGLGLFLVRKFVKYYSGLVELESVYGKGSTFTVKLLAN